MLIKGAAKGANQHDYREELIRITAAKDAGSWRETKMDKVIGTGGH